jgi:5-methylcytosine-specific restriction endonuclease McrA
MSAVLFLDHAYQPLRIESWERAITDFFLGKVEVIEYSRDRTIKGVGRELPMPAVVRVLRHFRRDKLRIRFSRLNVYARDRFTCAYCGHRFASEDLTFDHVVPRSRGGRTSWENIVSCCVPCNGEKSDRTPAEARMTLRWKPKKPAYLPTVTVTTNTRDVPPEWASYWTGALEA